MMVAMTAMLVSVAELSNIFSVLAVLICFCAMVLFIMRNMMVFRLHGEELMFGSSVHQVQHQIPQMKMMKVHIPFTFKLTETGRCSLADRRQERYPSGMSAMGDDGNPGRRRPDMQKKEKRFLRFLFSICTLPSLRPKKRSEPSDSSALKLNGLTELQCIVSSQVPYTLQALWGVSIRELHLFLWRPWSALQSQVEAGNLLEGSYQRKGQVIQKTSHNNEVINLSLPQPPLDLGTPPRMCYPLVIFLVRTDPVTMQPDETVALINVVHIKDSVCTLPTSILAQYLKQANGQLSCLKQLYMATGNPLSYEEEPATSMICQPEEDERSMWTSAGEQLCVVCQYFPLSRALLPCRHTCICASCFSKLDRCPMCRSPIRSYFCIRGEDYMPTETCGPTTKPPPMLQWLQDLNDRITDLLGFQR